MRHKLTRELYREIERRFIYVTGATGPDDPYRPDTINLATGEVEALLEAAKWALDDWYIGLDDVAG